MFKRRNKPAKAESAVETRRRVRRRLTIRGVLSFFIILTFIRSAFMHRYENMFVALLALILFCVPMLIERSLAIDIPPLMEGIIYSERICKRISSSKRSSPCPSTPRVSTRSCMNRSRA